MHVPHSTVSWMRWSNGLRSAGGYENVGEPLLFEEAMNKLLAQTRFASWLAPGSARRTERFVAMVS